MCFLWPFHCFLCVKIRSVKSPMYAVVEWLTVFTEWGSINNVGWWHLITDVRRRRRTPSVWSNRWFCSGSLRGTQIRAAWSCRRTSGTPWQSCRRCTRSLRSINAQQMPVMASFFSSLCFVSIQHSVCLLQLCLPLSICLSILLSDGAYPSVCTVSHYSLRNFNVPLFIRAIKI